MLDGQDRFAVWTYPQLGDEIAIGDPAVSDEERTAAGRETLAERTRALLASNRQRAHARYEAGPSLDDGDAVRVWWPRDPATLRARLTTEDLAVWADGDILHVLWRGDAERVALAGGIQPMLWRVPGADGLWETSLRIRRLDEAVISVVVFAERGRDLAPEDVAFGAPAPAQTVWRGPRAPAQPPSAEPLTGTLDNHLFDSAALGAAREVTVYRPPVGRGRLPVCVLADGQAVTGFAGVLEGAIRAGASPAVLLVGVHGATDPGHAGIDGRTREYLPSLDRRRFASHLRFVADEVIGWCADRGDCHTDRVVAAGVSNGAAWAIAAGQRRPDVFTAVAALSPGVVPGRITRAGRAAGVRHYLAAGILEPGFRQATQDWADRLRRAGLPCQHEEWIGGHDNVWWQQRLPAALDWLLRPPTP
jgi:enterochelin esterase-like enzyme